MLFAPFDGEEFTMMEVVGLVGAVPEVDGGDYLAVSHLNGGPNKLDAYMHRSVDYEATVDPITGDLDATVTVTLSNDAPAGLSNYAAGNQHNYPVGTNRAIVVVHTPHNAIEWTGGHEPELTRSWIEFGRQRHEQVVIVPRGSTRTVTLQLEGSVAPGDYELSVGHQPLVHDDAMTINVVPTTGRYGPEVRGAEFTLSTDTELVTTWTPRPETIAARAVGGEPG